jgi:hypothetical protein
MLHRLTLGLLGLLVVGSGIGTAADKPAGSLGQFAWLAGTWVGEKDGTTFEEHWTKAGPDGMIGLFRWVGNDGRVRVYEMLSLTEEGGTVVQRIRHLDAKLNPWASEKDGPTVVKLVQSNATAATFERKSDKGTLTLVYGHPDDDTMTVKLDINEGGQKRALNFTFQRAK